MVPLRILLTHHRRKTIMFTYLIWVPVRMSGVGLRNFSISLRNTSFFSLWEMLCLTHSFCKNCGMSLGAFILFFTFFFLLACGSCIKVSIELWKFQWKKTFLSFSITCFVLLSSIILLLSHYPIFLCVFRSSKLILNRLRELMKTLRYSFLIHIYHDFFFFENKKKNN